MQFIRQVYTVLLYFNIIVTLRINDSYRMNMMNVLVILISFCLFFILSFEVPVWGVPPSDVRYKKVSIVLFLATKFLQ